VEQPGVMSSYRIAVIPGDGIGVEVTAQACRVLRHLGSIFGFGVTLAEYEWGSDFYFRNGVMMPKDGLDTLRGADAILLGAVGDRRLQDNVTLGGLLLPIRQAFDQYANVRPVYLFDGVQSPLAGKAAGSIDCVVVRENTEGEYAQVGGRVHRGSQAEVAVQTAVFSYAATERIIRYAFDLARSRAGALKVTSITKSNAQGFSMAFWDDVFHQVAREYTDVRTESLLVDAACMDLIRRPEGFDVIVASNLFGDIVSEVTAAVTGGLGLAPSANINPDRRCPSMFEPVHGSAPDIAGKDLANPVAAVLATRMMLDFLGERQAAAAVGRAVERHLREGRYKTGDLGGKGTCRAAADEILGFLGADR
jgi:tartrate dehydrogenase/decarboxylase/D-malate dehydrogenase